MKVKNKIILVSIISIAALFITILGLTYAWFNIILKNQDKTGGNVVVKAANLGTITFYSGETISVAGAFPDWCETKKVSIKSDGATVKSNYSIYLNIVTNELAELGSTYGYMTMKTTVVESETEVTSGNIGNVYLQNVTQTSGKVLILTEEIGANDKHTYNVEFCFPELGIDQNSQQGKKFNAYLSVEVSNSAFGTDSWETILNNVRNNNISAYKVGDTKEVTLDGYGTQTLRIANLSTPDECNTEGFSQSACGFVLEFTDIIAKYNMNPAGTYNGTEYSEGTNLGGWPASSMYKFVNGTDNTTYSAYTTNTKTKSSVKSIYMSLPEDLKNIIIDTYVVSGHGSKETANFISTDKLYLLSPAEVWAQGTYGNKFITEHDTARVATRQLDYYLNQRVTTDSFTAAIKRYNGSAEWWWLRCAYYDSSYDKLFYIVEDDAHWPYSGASSALGVSPAFRIG